MNLDLRKIPTIYINLQKDTDKNEQVSSMLKNLEFKNVIRLNAFSFPEKPLSGCAFSWYNALQQVEPPFLVLEDDCVNKNFIPEIEVPDDADAVYLGISSWGRMNSHSGPFVQYKDVGNGMLKIYNMLSTHAILYLNAEYVSACTKVSKHWADIGDHLDIGFAEIQRYYNVYAFDDPMFYQTSSNGTDQPLSSYPTHELLHPHKSFWKPTALY